MVIKKLYPVIVILLLMVSSCQGSKYYKSAIEILSYHGFWSDYEQIKTQKKFVFQEGDSLITIIQSRRNLVFQNTVNKQYHVFLYDADITYYDHYTCDSTFKVLSHIASMGINY
jgi:membrane carboxypeptidase/penicillin-binding protein